MIHSAFSRLSGLPKTRFQGEGISSSHLPRRQSRAAHSRATFRRRSHPGRVVGEVTDEAGEEADIRGVNVGGSESLHDGGFDDAEAARAGVEERPVKAHDLVGDVTAGTARDHTEKDGVSLDHLYWSGG